MNYLTETAYAILKVKFCSKLHDLQRNKFNNYLMENIKISNIICTYELIIY